MTYFAVGAVSGALLAVLGIIWLAWRYPERAPVAFRENSPVAAPDPLDVPTYLRRDKLDG